MNPTNCDLWIYFNSNVWLRVRCRQYVFIAALDSPASRWQCAAVRHHSMQNRTAATASKTYAFRRGWQVDTINEQLVFHTASIRSPAKLDDFCSVTNDHVQFDALLRYIRIRKIIINYNMSNVCSFIDAESDASTDRRAAMSVVFYSSRTNRPIRSSLHLITHYT